MQQIVAPRIADDVSVRFPLPLLWPLSGSSSQRNAEMKPSSETKTECIRFKTKTVMCARISLLLAFDRRTLWTGQLVHHRTRTHAHSSNEQSLPRPTAAAPAVASISARFDSRLRCCFLLRSTLTMHFSSAARSLGKLRQSCRRLSIGRTSTAGTWAACPVSCRSSYCLSTVSDKQRSRLPVSLDRPCPPPTPSELSIGRRSVA